MKDEGGSSSNKEVIDVDDISEGMDHVPTLGAYNYVNLASPISICAKNDAPRSGPTKSVVEYLQQMEKRNALSKALLRVHTIMQVNEIPLQYDGNVAFEFLPTYEKITGYGFNGAQVQCTSMVKSANIKHSVSRCLQTQSMPGKSRMSE